MNAKGSTKAFGGLSLLWIYCLFVAVAQILCGGDLLVICLFLAIAGVTSAGLKEFGLYSHPGLLVALNFWVTVGIGVGAKTLMLEPLETRLEAPALSFTVVFLFLLGLVGSGVAVKLFLGRGKQKFPLAVSAADLMAVARYSAFFGFCFWAANRALAVDVRSDSGDGGGTGAFGALFPVFYFSILASTLAVLKATNGTRSFAKGSVFYIFLGILMALVDGQKMGIGMTVLTYLLCTICYRGRITKSQVMALGSFGFFGFFVLVPVIHIVRADLWQLGLVDRVVYVLTNYFSLVSFGSLFELQASLEDVEQSNFFSYFGANNLLLDRFALIQHIDAIVFAVYRKGFLDSSVLSDAFLQFLPRFLFPEKETLYAGDIITWQLGLRSKGVVGFPTVPAAAQLYSVGGALSVFLGAFFLGSLFFIVTRFLGLNYKRNLLSMYLVLLYAVSCAGWGVSHFSQKMLLALPSQVMVLLIILVISVPRLRGRFRSILSRGVW